MLAKNAERTLAATLSSLDAFPEVILVDTGSSDRTIEIAKTFSNVSIYQRPFTHFGELRNEAAALASHDWILAIDSDEVLTPALSMEIRSSSLCADQIYEICFHNFYNGKHILGCNWHPESHVRLYHRQKTQFSLDAVHERIMEDGMKISRLHHPILHTPYLSIADFLRKMQLYSDLFAQKYRGKKNSSLSIALGHCSAAFFKSYFLKRGFMLGKEGFIISSYNAITAFYKYLKLMEINKLEWS